MVHKTVFFTHRSGLRPGLLLLLDRRGGLSPRCGERPPLFQDWSSLGPPLDIGASLVGMLMPPPLLGGAMSWDCQAGDREQRKGKGRVEREVRACHWTSWDW